MSLEATSRRCVLVAGDDQPVLVHTIRYCQLQVPSSWDNASGAHLCFALDSPPFWSSSLGIRFLHHFKCCFVWPGVGRHQQVPPGNL